MRAGLREHGYVEGKNLVIEFRWAEGKYERLPDLATELARLNVELIMTHATPAARAAKQATSTIPIVMVVGDSVASGLVASLARPGGNITGLTFFQPELVAKRLELFKEAMPLVTQVAYLMNPDNTAASGPTLRATTSSPISSGFCSPALPTFWSSGCARWGSQAPSSPGYRPAPCAPSS